MAEMIEIDIETQLRGPLARRLLMVAKKTGKSPVEAMADLVETALGERAPGKEVDLLNEIARLRQLLAEKSKETPADIKLPNDVAQHFRQAAIQRGVKFDELIIKVCCTVARDNLFAAVLDAD